MLLVECSTINKSGSTLVPLAAIQGNTPPLSPNSALSVRTYAPHAAAILSASPANLYTGWLTTSAGQLASTHVLLASMAI